MRWLRAFFGALSLTLRGSSPPPLPYAAQREWTARMAQLVAAVYESAAAQGLDQEARRALVLHIEGRDMSMETILAALKYHAEEEYVYLFRHPTADLHLALAASNLNDAFWIGRLKEDAALQGTAVQQALELLAQHLERLPQPETDRAETGTPQNN